MKYDNPAARLLSIIEIGRSIPPNQICREAWQQLLNVQDNNALLMSRLGKVMELPGLAINQIKEMYPEQGDTWSHWSSQVNTGFMSQNLNATWSTFIGNIDTHTITYLRMSASLLEAKSNTNTISDADLQEIITKIKSLCDDIIESDMNDDIKKYLLRYIGKLVIALDEYKITGAISLLESIETTIGHAHIHPQYKSFLTDTELGKRILDTLGSMANVVTVAVGIPQLTQTIALLTQQ